MSKESITEQTTALTVNIAADDRVALTSAYNPLVEGLSDLLDSSKDVEVKTLDDTDAMKEARKIRLSLRSIRVNVENKRKELKANIVLKGKAIDGFANIIKAEIVPSEKYLQDQEDFVKREQERLAQERDDARSVEIAEHTATDYGVGTLGAMSDEVYAQLLDGAKIAKAQAEEAKRKTQELEDERKKKEAKKTADLINENKRLKEDKAAKDLKEKKRSKQLAPYISFIQNYADTVNLDDVAFDREMNTLSNEAAEQKKLDDEKEETRLADIEKANKVKKELDEANAETKRLKDEADEKENKRKQDIADANTKRLADIEKAKSYRTLWLSC